MRITNKNISKILSSTGKKTANNYNNFYWNDKEKRKQCATAHYKEMQKKYMNDIKHSIKYSVIIPEHIIPDHLGNRNNCFDTKYVLYNNNTLSSLENVICEFDDCVDKIAILNFASFKNPGGKYIEGSQAQEEALCHVSTLYNVLETFKESFYMPNKKKINNGMYDSGIIYSKDITFLDDSTEWMADVITCAAPNLTYHIKYNKNIDKKMVDETLRNRIDHVLHAAFINNIETLILGPFGCGVFKNNPTQVATIFRELLENKYRGVFKYIVFSLPIINNATKNTVAFYNVFKDLI